MTEHAAGRNRGRVRAASASTDLGAVAIQREAVQPTASHAARANGAAVGIEGRPLDRLEGRRGERDATALVLADERRRIAADIHDLIMQDLSFALATARTLVNDPALAPRAGVVVAAGERALAGAREVVSDLGAQRDTPVVEALERSVRVAARNASLTFDAERVPAHTHADRPTRDALVHIGREAVTNAVKHAYRNPVAVVLEYVDGWRLTVRDEGPGFDADRARGGFGLESMRAHARALGGSLRVTSTVEGTRVEAALP